MPPLRWLRKPKKLLVLDLNGLLFWRVRKGEVDLASLPCAPDATVGQFHIFRRPNAQEFLAWCSQHFAIAVWSTAQAKNVQPMVDLAFAGLPPPMAILDQSHCTDAGEAHPDDISGTRRLMLKELSRLWSMGAWAAPFGPSNTLLVDDSPYKVVANPAHTAIHPTEWQGPADPDPASHGALSPKGALRLPNALMPPLMIADCIRNRSRCSFKLEWHQSPSPNKFHLSSLHSKSYVFKIVI
jgi:hypothetical protein